MNPKATVIVFPGSNGDRDLYEAFCSVGFDTYYTNSNERIGDADVVGIPGGFSYGDYWRAGMLASRDKALSDISEVVKSGGMAIGICNGFQILVEAGFLPGVLYYNEPSGFLHKWLELEIKDNTSPWFQNLSIGEKLQMPMANGEGRYISTKHIISPAEYVENPNHSDYNIASALDETGRILGIMPHPERAIDKHIGSNDGLKIFKSAFDWF